jgi:hypothetical protein
VAAALLLALAGACTTPNHLPEEATRFRSAGGLQAAQPADVAVAPVRNQSGDESLPLDRLRELLYARLAERLYSPLDLAFVDAHWTEAGASVACDAELVVSITGWRTDLVRDTGLVAAGVDVYFVDPEGPPGQPLWGVSVTRHLNVGQDAASLPRADLQARAIALLASEILELIPERNPEAEPATAAAGGL